ncbi:MAG: T9SS type A sorting domain-containing protein [Chitinophagaceae bacterium]|nr:T9SS type A sorting domain-containing protein [Chitinophagaceae bacterium]
MKHRFKTSILAILIPIIVLTFPQSIQAQQLTGAFIMSSVGGLNNMSNNSMAVTFSSSATCLNVQNGTAVLSGDRGTGNFAINCEVNTIFNSLGIKLYPNPVGASTKVKFINTPPLTDQFTISVWNSEGFKINSAKATGYEIFQGKGMDFSSLIAGSYIIQIESEKYTDALKFIKAN